MDYLVKHNDIDVAHVRLDEDYRVTDVLQICNKDHLPNYFKIKNKHTSMAFDDWLQRRYIPQTRKGIAELLVKLNKISPVEILMENHALGLTDHYWLCESGDNHSWKDINYFENEYGEDIGKFLVGNYDSFIRDIKSPEGSSKGALEKYWQIKGRERYLIKSGSKPYYQEPVNEIVISKMLDYLNIEHTCYNGEYAGNKLFSSCRNYLGTENEEVPAWELNGLYNKTGMFDYHEYRKCLDRAGLDNGKLDQMICIDYITGNTDRHAENFGVMRNAETLQYTGIIPMFDFGNSLHYNTDLPDVNYDDDIQSVLFNSTHGENISKIENFAWLDINKLHDIPDLVYQELKNYDTLHNDRKDMIVKLLKSRILKIKLCKGGA